MTDPIDEFIAEGLAARTAPKSEQALGLPLIDMVRPRVNLTAREALKPITK
jgi:hypothetical protein